MDEIAQTSYTVEQNMRFIDLAFDCVFINSAEKEKTIKLLEEKTRETSDISVLEIFKQEKFVSEKRIARLLELDAHLKLQRKDQQFGKLATANGFASEDDIVDALHYQKKYFEKKRVTKKIGDILVENKTITRTHQISILLTQNRIKNEHLLDALNDMGETQLQKDAVNKRFCALAIKKKLVTIDQVNAALDVQKNDIRLNNPPRFIGRILQETADVSNDDILEVLTAQKQFEKRNLDLEKALYTVKSEIRISKKLNTLFEYSISKDGLEAVVKKIAEPGDTIPTYEFLIWLRRAGIKSVVLDDAGLETFIQNAKQNDEIIVAKGYPAAQCTDERIQFYFKKNGMPAQQKDPDPPEANSTKCLKKEGSTEGKTSESDPLHEEEGGEKTRDDHEPGEDGSEDDRQGEAEIPPEQVEVQADAPVPFIKKGGLLARIIPGKKGKPGKDVLGYPIQPDKPSVCVLNAGSGVMKKGLVFLAQRDGLPSLRNSTTLVVEPAVKKVDIETIIGSISKDTQDTYEGATVELRGTLTPEAVLRCHTLLLHGHLMGSVVCTGDIEVKGYIGRDKKPKDSDTIPFTDIMCQGSVKVSKSICNSRIQTQGELLGFNSTLVGSEVTAFNGITIKDCLKGETAPSVLRFGLKPDDKLIAVDHTIEIKTAELSVLKKEDDITELTEHFKKDMKEEETRQLEQVTFKNLIEIIKAPELYQHDGLVDKIKYLKGLPDFSSIKTEYLKLPETDTAVSFLNQILVSIEKMPLEKALEQFRQKIDPEPEDDDAVSNMIRIETNFKARLAAFEQECADQSEEIEKIENEIKGLQALREKCVSSHLKSLPRSISAITIKNKCQKGTIIKGKIARLVVEKTLYNVKFKEGLDPKSNTVSIIIETN